MGLNRASGKKKITTACVVALLVFLAPLLATGCGAETPEAAVQNFYEAIEEGNWNAYLSSILPENVRRMTGEDVRYEKERLEEGEFVYKDLKFETVIDDKNGDLAEVELTEGEIVGTNPETGEKETATIAEIKKQYDITPKFKVARYKGRWYVDVPLASADMPETTGMPVEQ